MSKRDINLYRKENPIMDFAIDQSFYQKAKAMLDKIDQNQKLQQLASANGIDVKNSTQLNEATKNNIATSVIALMLAKQSNDPRYADLVRYGMDHRKTKIEIINDYKDQANQIISRAKNTDFNTLSGFAETHLADPTQDGEIVQEGAGEVALFVLNLPIMLVRIVIKLITYAIKLISHLIRSLTGITPDKLIKKLENLSPAEKTNFKIKADANILKLVAMIKCVESIVEMYTYLVDVTLKIDVNSDYEDNTYAQQILGANGAWKLVKYLIYKAKSIVHKMRRMTIEKIKEEADKIVSAMEDQRDKLNNYSESNIDEIGMNDFINEEYEIFEESNNDISEDDVDSVIENAQDLAESNEEYLNYEQTMAILLALKRDFNPDRFSKMHKDFKKALDNLRKAERESRKRGEHENSAPMFSSMAIGGIKESSLAITWTITYMTYDVNRFFNSIIKQSIKDAKEEVSSSTS